MGERNQPELDILVELVTAVDVVVVVQLGFVVTGDVFGSTLKPKF